MSDSEVQTTEASPGGSVGSALRARIFRGAAWTLSGFILSNILRLGSNLILTRLLYPEAFGLVSLVLAFIQGLTMFSDLGLGVSIVQNPRGDKSSFLNTVWTLQVIRGGLLWLLCWAIAWPIANFYDQAQLTFLIPGVGLTALIAGFESTAVFTAQRHLQLKPVALMDLLSGALGSAVTILVALLIRSAYGPEHPGVVWAMVIGMTFGSLVRAVLSHTLLPDRRTHLFRLERSTLDEVVNMGRSIFLSSALTFLVSQSDRLIFAKMIPLDLFGVYGIAALLAGLPLLGIGQVARSVAFPVYSRMSTAGEEFKTVFSRTRRPLLLAGATLVSGMMACGPLLTRILYDTRYEQAGWILQLLTVATWFQLLETFNSNLLLAQGRTNWLAAGSAAKLLCMIVLLPVGYHLDGFRGALIGMAVSELAKYLLSLVALTLRGLQTLSWDIGFTVLVVAFAYSGTLAGEALGGRGFGDVPAFLTAGTTTATLWGLLGFLYWSEQRARRRASQPNLSSSGSV